MLFLSSFCYAFDRVCSIDALWSFAGKGLTYWLLFVMSNCEVVTFPFVSWVRWFWCLFVSISDLCPLPNLYNKSTRQYASRKDERQRDT